ncbi:MAG: NAD(P)/FAD-dependent oxidoreductase [Myxococcales bacterium]|nr:NAD(P)/FAD-dependent oxidoreductase [Myxococcales bacterium]
MTMPAIVIVGAGINGLVAANYLQRSGCDVTMIERAHRVGGACVSEIANVGGEDQCYALGASVFGHMQRFIYEDTGLASRLQVYISKHPELVHFLGDEEPTWISRNPAEMARELADKWGENGDVEGFRADEARVIHFLQDGFVNALPPSISDAKHVLGDTLTHIWISGTARSLLDHYFTSERMKIFTAMKVTESGPVSLDDPYTAFTLPRLNSGSIFDGDYRFVKSGIWRVTEELGAINDELEVTTHLSSKVLEVDTVHGNLTYERNGSEHRKDFDFLIFGTDPLTACRLVGNEDQVAQTQAQRFRGTSGKLNLMFKDQVRWKHNSKDAGSDAAFRYFFSVNDLAEFEKATLDVLDDAVAYAPYGFGPPRHQVLRSDILHKCKSDPLANPTCPPLSPFGTRRGKTPINFWRRKQ